MVMGSRNRIGSLTGVMFLLSLSAGCGRTPPANPTARKTVAAEDYLASAREQLQSAIDQAGVQGATHALRQHLEQLPAEKRRELGAETRKRLAVRWGLTDDEIGEVAAANLTALDVAYLDSCLLFREAARGLALDGLASAERARAAFQWCMRQVRWKERPGLMIPPHLVLRRGWGAAAERSLVFLALAQQLGLDTCLVMLPGPAQDQPRFWVCGVWTAGAKGPDILLFDPRLGLPLPGPKGIGIATLTEVRADPGLLKQLNTEKEEYDISAEQLRHAEIRLAAPLSALAPRMQTVEEQLGTGMRVRLAQDADELLKKFDGAAAALPEGTRPPVRGAQRMVCLLRNFLPPTEGGVARGVVREFPDIIEPPALTWPPQLNIGGKLQENLQYFLLRPFVDFSLRVRMPRDEYLRGKFIYLGTATNPDAARLPIDLAADASSTPDPAVPSVGKRDVSKGSIQEKAGTRAGSQAASEALDRARMPRDLVLRGQQEEAAKLLVDMERQLRAQQERFLKAPQLNKKLAEWSAKIVAAQANVLRADNGQLPRERAYYERDLAWQEGEGPRNVALEGAAAPALLEEVLYQLALCNHEKAERLQQRLDRNKAPTAAQTAEVRNAWREAAQTWDNFLQEHGARPLAGPARRWRARIYELTGEKEAAARMLQAETAELPLLERLARNWEAQRLK